VIARLEYRRGKRRDLARRRALIELIRQIVGKYEAQIQQYVSLGVDSAEAAAFDRDHMNDPEWHSMRDLAFMPVMQWPSARSYAAFKQYWFASNEFKKIGHLIHTNKKTIYHRWKAQHDEAFAELTRSLATDLRP
jgi:hypothetical protein